MQRELDHSGHHAAVGIERGADEIRHVFEAVGRRHLAGHGLRALPDAGAVAVALGHPFDAGIVDGGRDEAVGHQHGGAGVGRGEAIDAGRYIILALPRTAGYSGQGGAPDINDPGIARPGAERRRGRYIIWARPRGHGGGFAVTA